MPLSPLAAAESGTEDDPFVPLEPSAKLPATHDVSPVDQDLLRQAEANYQRGRFELAREQFGQIAAMNDHPFAWLRVGNIWHRQGRSAMAIDAYSRAGMSAAAVSGHRGIAQRAQKNLALLGLELTGRALREVGSRTSHSGADRWMHEMRRQLVQLESSLPRASVASRQSGDPIETDSEPPRGLLPGTRPVEGQRVVRSVSTGSGS